VRGAEDDLCPYRDPIKGIFHFCVIHYTSIFFATNAFVSINARLGST
jgi:hypothetical protein